MKYEYILGHTFGAVIKDEFLNELAYNKEKDKHSKKGKIIRNYDLVPKLRQVKLELRGLHFMVYVYRPLDFKYKKHVSKFTLDNNSIKNVVIRMIGNNNPNWFSRVYKIKFYNTNNEEVLYFNIGSKEDKSIVDNFEILERYLIENNIEFIINDETFFA